jgi:NAD(P)-dependent dehydrogenase (short-subunit alcohol dehydrogenase family)
MTEEVMSYITRMFGLDGKVAVLTGGGGVIAGAISAALLESGASVALWDIAQDALDEAKERLVGKEGSERVLCLTADATDEESVRTAIDETEKALGAPDLLVNAAGGNRGKSPFVESDKDTFEFVLKLNLVAGLMVPTKVMAAYWIEKKRPAAVINLASMASYIPLSGIWAYNAAKAGVLNLTMALAKELAAYKIRVNAIAPGFFIGKQNKDLLIKDEATGELTERGKAIIERTPFGRFGEVSELAGAALFLASEEAAGFITGVTLPVDGGYLADNI